ncbi:aldehyde dehydrogenase family protein [uncultured Pigmentiphaga sp.]|uniref:aldehyde dehydrogenase family protein n=1 Tax=uncultured Pigmentiphaga sp. TaxID=340361 RepID=UPI0026216EA4|nr:aldehyde dehydrogenase family protein [uncultured Pigmentiphaga sp.]
MNAHTGSVIPRASGHFYDGRWHASASGRSFAVVNPATQALLGTVSNASAEDVHAAVESARKAFPSWRRLPIFERAALLRKAAAALREHDRELALLDALNCGNPVSEMVHDVHAAAAMLEYFAGLIPEIKGDTIPMNNGSFNFTVREPLGVVARIYPSNHPLLFAGSRIAAPLAAGNTVVVKPPEQAPLSSIRMMELFADIFPAGVLNCVNGDRDAGAALVSHPLVAKVALTGGEQAGKAVLHAAADQIKPTLLELGGKNALVVYPDADMEAAVSGAVRGMNFLWAGQSCGSTSRVYVHESIHDAFLERFVAGISAAHRPGLPEDPATTMGCLGHKNAFDKTMYYIETALAEGARLVLGGKRPDDPRLANGWFVEPTVFADVRSDMRVAQEEIFGPVVVVIKWSDEDKLIEEVNALNYGLTCSIWTRDLDTAIAAAHRVEAGYVWINGSSSHAIGAPFGGYKRSGLGREECLEELFEFTQVKNINIARRP